MDMRIVKEINFPAKLEKWRKHVMKALNKGGLIMSYNDVLTGLLKGHFLLFENDKAFSIVEIRDFPNMRTAHILLTGGALSSVRQLQGEGSYAIQVLRQLGVRKLTMLGRDGWDKYLPQWGWSSPMTYHEKRL